MKLKTFFFFLLHFYVYGEDIKHRPNILFAIADDWSFGHAGAYGCKWINTPAFDRLAKEGILFNRAYTPNAKCAPSRAIILTGRNSWQLEEAANHMNIFPFKFKGWMEVLAENGYSTGYTGKGWGPGIAKNSRGIDRLITGIQYSKEKLTPPGQSISKIDYSANFASFLNENAKGKPWAFWFGTSEPHRGYEKGIGQRMGKKLSDIDRVPKFWPDNEIVRNDMLDYAIEVEHFDNHLGQILQILDQSGISKNTIVIATSDHGMPFPRCKGQAYDYSNHIPMAIRWPSGIQGNHRIVDDYVSFADFAPTFLQVANVLERRSGMQAITGQSLLDIFSSPKSGQVNLKRDHVLIGKERHDVGRPFNRGYPIRGIVKDDFLYIRNFEPNRWPVGNPETGYLNCDGSPTKTLILEQRREEETKFWKLNFGKRRQTELYDLKIDPDCVNNLAGYPKMEKIERSLREKLQKELKIQKDPRMYDRGFIFDKYPFVGDWNHFYERYTTGKKTPRTGWVNYGDYEKSPLK